MKNTIISIAALAAPALVAASTQISNSGGALIINKCNQDIPLQVVPASGSDVDTAQSSDVTLAANNVGSSSQFFTHWVSLGDNGGWSLKLNTLGNWNNIMQYEYTWTGDSNVWYDMSFVNGVESDFPDWQFVADGGEATTNAYQFSTDDEQGMNPAVPTSATVTLLLCPASTGSSSQATAPAVDSSSAPEVTTSSYVAPPVESPSSTTLVTSFAPVQKQNTQTSAPPATTEAPAAPPASDAAPVDVGFEVVTEFATQVVTAVVYETQHAKARRHEHGHPHGLHH